MCVEADPALTKGQAGPRINGLAQENSPRQMVANFTHGCGFGNKTIMMTLQKEVYHEKTRDGTVGFRISLGVSGFGPKQSGRGLGWGGGWGTGTPYQRLYNPATVETISGTIQSIDRATSMKGMSPGFI